jgi:hypothetical protein
MLEGMEPTGPESHARLAYDCSAKYCKYTSNPSRHDLRDKVGADVVGAEVVGNAVGAVGIGVGGAVGIGVGGAVGIGVGGVVGAADAPSAEEAVLPKATAQLTPTITATTKKAANNTFRVKMLPPRGFTSSANRGLCPTLATSPGPSSTSE